MESCTTIELEFQKVMLEKVAVVDGVGPNTIKEVSNNYVDTVESISRSTDKSEGQVVDSSAKVNVVDSYGSRNQSVKFCGENWGLMKTLDWKKQRKIKVVIMAIQMNPKRRKPALLLFPSEGYLGGSERKNSAIMGQPKHSSLTINPFFLPSNLL